MSNIEKIKAYIERQRGFIEGLFIEGDNNFYDGQDDAYNNLLAFIDSLPDEKPSEDLEEAAEEYYDNTFDELGGFAETRDGSYDIFFPSEAIRRSFIAVAEWQKQQMTKDAVEGEIGYWNQKGLSIRLDQSLEKLGYDEDTKVKIIIVKQ